MIDAAYLRCVYQTYAAQGGTWGTCTWINGSTQTSAWQVVKIGDSLSCGYDPVLSTDTSEFEPYNTELSLPPLAPPSLCHDGFSTSDVVGAPLTTFLQASKPGIALLWLGVNDITRMNRNLYQFRQNYSAIIQQLLGLGCVPVCVTLPPFVGQPENWIDAVPKFNAAICAMAAAFDVPCVDIYPALSQMANSGHPSVDGIHLGPAGYQQVAQMCWLPVFEILNIVMGAYGS